MTAVIDSSIAVDVLLRWHRAKHAAAMLKPHARDVHAPQLILPETIYALRGIERGGKASSVQIARALRDVGRFPTHLWGLCPLTKRVWQLRHAVSTYDAYYIALAEHLNARLVTADARLARAIEAAGWCPVDLVI